MACSFRPLDQTAAETIAAWRYDGPYAFCNLDQDPEDLAEFMEPASWPGRYFAVDEDADGPVGFFGFERTEEGWVTVGLGMRPDLTGRGLGQAFLESGLAFARERWQPEGFRLAVAAFNRRAIRLYQKVGFVPVREYIQATNGGDYPFVEMVLGR